jgi:hypothetical protein
MADWPLRASTPMIWKGIFFIRTE